ncbi:hypothetical protein GCM10027168_67070 [Streptomyces capparidis]
MSHIRTRSSPAAAPPGPGRDPARRAAPPPGGAGPGPRAVKHLVKGKPNLWEQS